MTLDSFHLRQAVFEARFAAAFILWDRAGSIWTQMLAKYPALKNTEGSPARTIFRLGDGYELVVEIDKLSVRAHRPNEPALLEMGELANHLVAACVEKLNLSDFTRLGLRTIYGREYETEAAAAKEMLELKLLRVPERAPFVAEATVSTPEYAIRCENKATGALVRIKSESQIIRAEFPFAWAGELLTTKEESGLVFDVDYYTRLEVGVGQLNPAEWLAQSLRIVRRGSRDLLEE